MLYIILPKCHSHLGSLSGSVIFGLTIGSISVKSTKKIYLIFYRTDFFFSEKPLFIFTFNIFLIKVVGLILKNLTFLGMFLNILKQYTTFHIAKALALAGRNVHSY